MAGLDPAILFHFAIVKKQKLVSRARGNDDYFLTGIPAKAGTPLKSLHQEKRR
jgi:hypothetical protein